MDCSHRTPSHLVLHGDHFVEATKYQVEPVYPKTIDYKHTIRMLPAACDHENEIEKLTKRYQRVLSEKDGEIQQLKKMLMEKENYGPIHVIQDKEGNTLQP